MSAISRYNYSHEIRKMKNDNYLGKKIPRSTTYLITFRVVNTVYT